jgi:dTDP-4-amino-4,6-dideoxygalactose transaminase
MLGVHGVGPGDRVVVPAHTCIATWLAVSAIGAKPVPVDVDPETLNIDAEKILRVRDEFSAILAVHMHGRVADMSGLRVAASLRGVPLLVDACQAHGIKGAHLGDAAAFSFYPTKNLGALGDGGAILTDDEGLAEELRRLRNLGASKKDEHKVLGGNSRLDELQAAFLRAKLPHLEQDNARRARNAELYGFQRVNSVWHHCVEIEGQRSEMRKLLQERGVETMVHYPRPPHLQQAYQHLELERGSFPIAEAVADHCLSLPCGPELSEATIKYVRECVQQFKVAA